MMRENLGLWFCDEFTRFEFSEYDFIILGIRLRQILWPL